MWKKIVSINFGLLGIRLGIYKKVEKEKKASIIYEKIFGKIVA